MSQTLQPGARYKLQPGPLDVTLDVPASYGRSVRCAAFVLGPGKLGEQPPLHSVFGGDRSGLGVEYLSGGYGGFRFDPSRMQGQTERVVVAVWINELERRRATNLKNLDGLAAVLHQGGSPVARFQVPLDRLGLESALFVGEVYCKSGTWRFKCDGNGFVGGLPSLGNRVGLADAVMKRLDDSADRATADPPPPSAPSAGAVRGGAASVGLDPRIGAGLKGQMKLPSGWAGGQAPKVPSGLVPCVGRVIVETESGAIADGTAFAVSPGGALLTCHHVIEDAVSLHVEMQGSHERRQAIVVASAERQDLALIRFADPWGCEQWMRLDTTGEPPELGLEVGLLGFPLGSTLGLEVAFSRGVVNSVRSPNGTRVIQLDAGTAPGGSGGPLFRMHDGVVIGAATSVITGSAVAMSMNFAVSLHELKKLGWVP